MSEFLKSVMSNESGSGSSNRVALLLIVCGLLIWSTIAVWRTGEIPDISESWIYLVGIFVGGVSLGKATDAYTTVKTPPAAGSEAGDAPQDQGS